MEEVKRKVVEMVNGVRGLGGWVEKEGDRFRKVMKE